MGVDPMVWVFSGYGLALVAVGWGFDLLARRAGRQSARWRQGKFTYHESHDAWRCPEDQWLWPTSFDPDNRVMRYRGKPSICNACPVKDTCTSSSHGRQMTREVDPWPHSETGRFHRGIALAVAAMGLVLTLAMMLLYRAPAELAVLVAASALIAVATWPLAVHLWRSPANFPTPTPLLTGEEDQAATAQDRFSSRWRSGLRDRTGAGTRWGGEARPVGRRGERTR